MRQAPSYIASCPAHAQSQLNPSFMSARCRRELTLDTIHHTCQARILDQVTTLRVKCLRFFQVQIATTRLRGPAGKVRCTITCHSLNHLHFHQHLRHLAIAQSQPSPKSCNLRHATRNVVDTKILGSLVRVFPKSPLGFSANTLAYGIGLSQVFQGQVSLSTIYSAVLGWIGLSTEAKLRLLFSRSQGWFQPPLTISVSVRVSMLF